jgi:Glyoxalase superfamily protein/Clp amino terminal domain, pathogenicity island component/Bacterial translation initiation factor IF-2 associated region
MRDFRAAKAMAHTLRAALAAKGFKITIGQSLELIAEIFGVADWNTLAAASRQAAQTPGENGSPRPPAAAEWAPAHTFSRELELTLHRALVYANERAHEYATLEHLLLALIDDADASAVMKACKVDLGALKQDLTGYVANELKTLVTDGNDDARPTAAFQRVVQRAVLHIGDLDRDVTGRDLLVAMFAETESPAVWFLGEREMTRQDAANVILHRIKKGGGDAVVGRRRRHSPSTPEADEMGKRSVEQGVVRQSFSHARTKPVVVEKVKRRTAAPMQGKTAKDPRRPPGWRDR